MGMFDGRWALVTGGDRGIGRGIATRLGEEDAAVCLVARDRDALAEVRTELGSVGADCEVVDADLATVEGARAAAQAALSISSRWDILVNDAGNPPGPHLLDTELDYWDETFAVHVRAPFVLAQALAPGMIEGGGGSILNVSSTASLDAQWGHGAYSSAKAALNMLTREMALEWGSHNIKANAILPTAVMTEMGQEVWGSRPVQAEWLQNKIPAGRFAEVEDVVGLAVYLLGPTNSFVSGAIIPCDGGMSAGWADRPPTS